MTLTLEPVQSKDIWEKFILTHCPQALFQSWLWGEVQKKTAQTVYRFAVMNGREVIGLAQIFVVAAKRGKFLHIRHGPVWKGQNERYWKEFCRVIVPFAKTQHAWFVRMSPLVDNIQKNRELFSSLHLIAAPIHEVDAERCWVLDVDHPEDELLMGMRKTTRYEIRLAQKLGVVVKKSVSPGDLKYFYQLYRETSQRHGFVAHSAISEEFEIFAREDKALLLLGYYNGELIAATIVLFYGGAAIYHHGASVVSRAPVSYLLQWEAIREAQKRGIKLYNFYGIAPDDKPNHPWRGITLFKKGFGGREINYIHAHDLPISPLYIIPKSIETIRRKIRGY